MIGDYAKIEANPLRAFVIKQYTDSKAGPNGIDAPPPVDADIA